MLKMLSIVAEYRQRQFYCSALAVVNLSWLRFTTTNTTTSTTIKTQFQPDTPARAVVFMRNTIGFSSITLTHNHHFEPNLPAVGLNKEMEWI